MLRAIVSENRNIIEGVLKHPEIYPTISDDDAPAVEDFKVEFNDQTIFLVFMNKDVVVGMCIFTQYSLSGYDIHFQILPQFRQKFAMEAGAMCITWFWENIPNNIQYLRAKIPTLYSNVYKFAINNGFVMRNVHEEQHYKNRKAYDMHVLFSVRGAK